jgi:hypothetical protein
MNIDDKLKETIREAVSEAISETLTKYGVDTSNPHSMQADLIHLRKSRLGSDEVAKWIKRSIITIAISTIIATVINGIKQVINGE